jgi:hypothetical protein
MSNKIHNGNARRKFLSINKTDQNGVSLTGYPKVYSIVEAFPHPAGNEPALTNVEFANLTDGQYVSRLNKFVEKVGHANVGIEVDIPDLKVGAVVYSTACDVSVEVPPGGTVTDSIGSGNGSSIVSDDLVQLT